MTKIQNCPLRFDKKSASVEFDPNLQIDVEAKHMDDLVDLFLLY